MSAPDKKGGVDFDAFAEDYDAVHQKNLGALGKDLSVFARYKVRMTAELLSSSPANMLEFGCGTGRNLPFFRQQFPKTKIHACDISDASLHKARQSVPGLEFFTSPSPESLLPFAATFDLVFLSCVLHHISPHERQIWADALAATLKPGGSLILFEHNPWNPVTRHMVSTCPFDEGVTLVWPPNGLELLRKSGLRTDHIRYTLLFPWRHRLLLAVEKLLARIPLGGQYCLLAQKPPHA